MTIRPLRRRCASATLAAVLLIAAKSGLASGSLALASHVFDSPSSASNGRSDQFSFSSDGRYLAFCSQATNLITGGSDANAGYDAFLWDRGTGAVTLISHAAGQPSMAANGGSFAWRMSADGRYVTFYSDATNLIAGGSDTNTASDVFFWDRFSNTVTLVSHAFGSATTTANAQSGPGAISANGRYVTFTSNANNLIAGATDSNGSSDVFLWDRDTNLVTLATHAAGSPLTAANGTSFVATMSDDGRYLAITSNATDLIAGGSDTNVSNDAFVWDRDTDIVTLVSHAAAGSGTAGNFASSAGRISADGRYLAFASSANDLIPGGVDSNGTGDAFLWDRDSGATTLVSHTAASQTTAANNFSNPGVMSADGRYLAFESSAVDLIAGASDSNGDSDVFVWDRNSGAVTLMSHTPASPSTAGSGASFSSVVSADGIWWAFQSLSANLIAGGTDANGAIDAFLWNRQTGAVSLVSHAAVSDTIAANSASSPMALSTDGTFLALHSSATNLMPGTFNAFPQAFVAQPLQLFADGFEDP